MKKTLLLSVLACACGLAPAPEGNREMILLPASVVATPDLIHSAQSNDPSTVHFARPASIRANDSLTVIVDIGDDLVVVLDSLGRLVRRVGIRGSGPGELRGATHVALRRNSMLIGEAGNGRISEFGLDGGFIATLASGFGAGSLSADSESVYITSRSSAFYASRVTPGGTPIDAFRRPATGGSANQRWTRLPGHDLLATVDRTTWVFDQASGILCAYSAPDAKPQCYTMPPQILQRLHRYRAERVTVLEQSIGMRVEAAPLAKDLVVAGSYLALLLPVPEIPLLLVRLTDASLTPVRILGDSLPDWVRTARGLAWDGKRFLLVGEEGFGRLDLQTTNSTHQ